MEIPVQNIYYLLCYAWNRLDEGKIVEVDPDDQTDLLTLFAKVLCNGVSRLLRRGLDRGYIDICEGLPTIKGKIEFNTFMKLRMHNSPRVFCIHDDFNHNVLHNQIVKTTLRSLMRIPDFDKDVQNNLIFLYRRLRSIDDIRLTKRHFGMVQLNRNNSFYDFLLKICELIHDRLLISEKEGKSKFSDFIRDKTKMRLLFEEFVRNFYKIEQKNFHVRRENIYWNAMALSEESKKVLPIMQNDISLESSDRKIVIETKFPEQTLIPHMGKLTIKPSHLYQLYAYIKNIETKSGMCNKNCEGMLLYPTVNQSLNYKYEFPGHRVTVKSINLDQDWKIIHDDLLNLVN